MWKYYATVALVVLALGTGTVGLSFPEKPEPKAEFDLLEGISPEEKKTACEDLDKMIKEEQKLWLNLYAQTLQCGPPERFRCANRYMHSGLAMELIKMMERTQKKHCRKA